MRKRIKRGGAVLLALTLALTPVTLRAEEGVPEQTEKSLAGTEEGQFSADVNTADSKETSQTESVKETPQAETGVPERKTQLIPRRLMGKMSSMT